MSEYNERKLLRRLQALSQIEPDLESTERAMAGVRKAILELPEEATRPKRPFGIGSKQGLLWYAAAAVVVIVIVFGVALIWKDADDKSTREVAKQPDTRKDEPAIAVGALEKESKDEPPPEELKDVSPGIKQELERIFVLAGANDVEGLIHVLEEGEFASKLVATGYLMQIGDARAIEPLEKLSVEWYGLNEVNPFATAVKAIKSRTAKEVADAANDVESASGPRITGTVADGATGRPVTKFRVRLRKVKSPAGLPQVQNADWSTYDNEEGVFDVAAAGAGMYQVQVHAAGYSLAWSGEISTDEDTPVLIELAAGGTIRGEVVDSAGKGISGAKVIPLSLWPGATIESDGAKAFVRQEVAVETVDGKFELKHVPEGLESIKVVHPDYGVAFQKEIEVRNGYMTGGIVVTLHKGSTVEGYVYDRTGRPEPNVTLYVQDADPYSPGKEYAESVRLATATTDPNGFYRADGLPSERMYYISRKDRDQRTGVVSRAVVPGDAKTTRLDFGAGPMVSGQVMVDGRFLANSTMLLTDPERSYSGVFRSYAVSDAQGGFSFRGAPVGRHGVYMEPAGQRGVWFRIATVHVDADDVELGMVELATSTIEVQVQADDPNQVPEDIPEGATVYLQQGRGFTGAMAGIVQEPYEDGAPYAIRNVLPGEYTVVASRPDGVHSRKELAVGAVAETISMAMSVPRGSASLSGRFIGRSPGAMFLFSADGKVASHIDSDDAGTYRIGDMPAGDYLVGNDLVGKTVPLLVFNIAEGDDTVADLDMSDWPAMGRAPLHTQVVSDAGVPVSGVQVWLEGEGVEVEPVRNNSEGQFFVTEPGEYVIHADYPGLGRASRAVVLLADDISARRRTETTIILRLTQQ